jgi:NAD+ kinase
MKVGIYSRDINEAHYPQVQHLLHALHKQEIEICVYYTLANELIEKNIISSLMPQFSQNIEPKDAIDILISLGGDGTMLDTVSIVKNLGIPVLGINFGTLGFLANFGKDEIETVVDALQNHTFVIDKRTLIHVDGSIELFKEAPFALNEFAIHKRDTSPMIKIHTYLNGDFLNTYWCDGLIISTPTGSTGYSLSCQGPIVFPDAASFVITPVAPHNLNVRSIVVPDSTIISFEVEGRTEEFICTLDSKKQIVPKNVQVAIKKEEFMFSLVRLNENNFLQTLRNKLSWGLDKRN